MAFVVTRQHYYYSGRRLVEVAQGGRDYSGSDALSARYEGEFEEFDDPREAVSVAIAIQNAWRKDSKSGNRIGLTVCNTMGMGLEGEPIRQRDAIKLATKLYEALPKCDNCDKPLKSERRGDYWYITDDYEFSSLGDCKYCSEYCCDRAIEAETKYQAETGQRCTECGEYLGYDPEESGEEPRMCPRCAGLNQFDT